MPDITKIDTSYYGTKDEWLNVPGITNTNFKIPKWGSIKNAYDTKVLDLNQRLNSSFYMFGMKGESDFLHPCSMIYDEHTGYKLIHEKLESSEIGFFAMQNANIIQEGLIWRDSFNTVTGNNNLINGKGLKYPVASNYTYINYPLIDFDYTEMCSLLYIGIIKQEKEHFKQLHVTLDDYLTNINQYSDYKIKDYYHIPRGGTYNSRAFTRFFSNTNSTFRANDLIEYDIFSYFPRTSIVGGGEFNPYYFEYGDNKKLARYFFANPKYWKIQEFTDINYGSIFTTVFKGTIDDLLMLASYIGICFTGNEKSAGNAILGENLTDEKIYVPVIKDGILSGEYKKGSAGAKLSQMTWGTDIREKTGYKGLDSIDPTEYTDKISLARPKIKSEGKFNTLYALSDTEINSLSDELWSADENKLNQILKGLLLMGENPLNCIVSLQLFPFDITSQAGTSSQGSITLGANQMNTTGTKVKNLNSVIDIGSVKLRRHFNNFFDYEPYSTAFIYVPYCGTIQLSLNDVIGKIVSVKLLIDYITGVCTAVVFADGIPVIYKNGCISQQIAITGTDTATMSSNAISSSLGLLTNTTNLIAGGKDVSTVINNSANLLSSSFDYSARRTIYQTQGANTSQINMCEPQKAYIVLNLPKFDIADEYSSLHGFRCDFYDSVKNLSGYVETDRPNLTGISATEEEKQMLSEIMTGGFYV